MPYHHLLVLRSTLPINLQLPYLTQVDGLIILENELWRRRRRYHRSCQYCQ